MFTDGSSASSAAALKLAAGVWWSPTTTSLLDEVTLEADARQSESFPLDQRVLAGQETEDKEEADAFLFEQRSRIVS